MEYEGMKSYIESGEIIIPDRLGNNFDVEIKEEYWTVMENAKSEEQATDDNDTIVSPEIYPTQRSEENSQFYVVRLPLRCRLCSIPDNDMVDIFDPNGTDKSIVEKIECCLPIVVKETDHLPKQACQLCLANLELCYQFHKTVAEAERQLLAFNRPSEPERSCLPSPTCYDNIDGHSMQSLNAETSSNERTIVPKEVQTADMTAKSNVQLADLKPYSVVLCISQTLGKNNLDTESVDAFKTERTPAYLFDQQSTCDSEVPGDTLSRIFSLQSAMGVEHQAKPAIQKWVDPEGPPYKCDYCPKSFKTKSHRTCHNKIHVGYGPYGCLYCNKEFVLLSHRDRHHRTHTGERPFKCSVCDKTFAGQKCLKRHVTVHSEPTNFPCSLCDKSFETSASKKLHVASHMVVRSWQCDYCKVYFIKKCGLRKHIRFCKECDKSVDVIKFEPSDPNDLQQHVFSNF